MIIWISMTRLHLILLLCLLGGFSAAPAFARESYFNMSEVESLDLKPFPKWTGVMRRYGEQRRVADSECDAVRYHPCDALHAWRAMLSDARDKPYLRQLDEVNDWANRHPYIIDQLNWGVEDYWETPYEFISVNGDCEDYAIAKYYSLRALGVAAEKLRVIIVQDFNLGGIIHAVLAAYDGDDMLILDNQSPAVIPAMHIYHYRPIYGVNERAWWVYHPREM
jgi:predicted transglutaminase-like cysteine proteinase